MLAMLALVASSSFVMLTVSVQRVEQAHEGLYRARMAEQLNYLPREQEARLGIVRAKSEEFAELPEVQLAMEQRDGLKLYQLGRRQMQAMLAKEFEQLTQELTAHEGRLARLAWQRRTAADLGRLATVFDTRAESNSTLPSPGDPLESRSAPPEVLSSLLKGNAAPLYGWLRATKTGADRAVAGELRKLSHNLERSAETLAKSPLLSATEPVPLPVPAPVEVSPPPSKAGKAGPGAGAPKGPAVRSPREPYTASFMAFVGEQGEMITPPVEASGFFESQLRRQFRDRVQSFVMDILKLDGQAVGYVAVGDKDQRQVIEVVFTPVEAVGGGRQVGVFLLGFPMQTRGEQTLSEVSAVQSGLWVGGEIHSHTIPTACQQPLAAWLKQATATSKADDAESYGTVDLCGIPYGVFYTPLNDGYGLPVAYKVGLYSWAEPLAMKADLRAQVLVVGSVMGLVAMALSWLLSHGLAQPLRRLHKATLRLQRGDYSTRLPVPGRDEIGQLTAAFNATAEQLGQKERLREVLNKVTDPNVAEQLLARNGALGGETRRMTVLFCDIRRYTELTAGLPPQQIVALLNEHMTAMTRVVHQNGGVVDKFVGDMVMAVFGAVTEDLQAPAHAVACARGMLAERQHLNDLTGRDIKVGIGIATGEMLAGFMGSANRLNFTVIGRGANLASRLCSAARPMEILADEATFDAAHEQGEMLPPLEIKGFSEPQGVYRLAGAATLSSSISSSTKPA